MPPKRPPPPSFDPDIPYGAIEDEWESFQKFLRAPGKQTPAVKRVSTILRQLLKEEPEVVKTVFAAGFLAGFHWLTSTLEEMRDMAHLQHAMEQRPKKDRPRA